MDKKILERYAQLKIQEKEIQDEINMLGPQVLAEVKTVSDEKPVELSDIGTFTITKRKKWKFSHIVEEIQKTLEETKKKQMANGEATFEEQEILVFKALERS